MQKSGHNHRKAIHAEVLGLVASETPFALSSVRTYPLTEQVDGVLLTLDAVSGYRETQGDVPGRGSQRATSLHPAPLARSARDCADFVTWSTFFRSGHKSYRQFPRTSEKNLPTWWALPSRLEPGYLPGKRVFALSVVGVLNLPGVSTPSRPFHGASCSGTRDLWQFGASDSGKPDHYKLSWSSSVPRRT